MKILNSAVRDLTIMCDKSKYNILSHVPIVFRFILRRRYNNNTNYKNEVNITIIIQYSRMFGHFVTEGAKITLSFLILKFS